MITHIKIYQYITDCYHLNPYEHVTIFQARNRYISTLLKLRVGCRLVHVYYALTYVQKHIIHKV